MLKCVISCLKRGNKNQKKANIVTSLFVHERDKLCRFIPRNRQMLIVSHSFNEAASRSNYTFLLGAIYASNPLVLLLSDKKSFSLLLEGAELISTMPIICKAHSLLAKKYSNPISFFHILSRYKQKLMYFVGISLFRSTQTKHFK